VSFVSSVVLLTFLYYSSEHFLFSSTSICLLSLPRTSATDRRDSLKRKYGGQSPRTPRKGKDPQQVEAKMKKKGEKAFQQLKKMFLGAMNTLDEDAFKQALVDCQSLIDAGYLDLNRAIKDTQSTFLHTAVWFKKLDLVRFLLANGANPNASNLKGNTPLHFACENADKGPKAKEIVSLLIAAGGDLKRKNLKKQSGLDMAKAVGLKDFVLEVAETHADKELAEDSKRKEWRKSLTDSFRKSTSQANRSSRSIGAQSHRSSGSRTSTRRQDSSAGLYHDPKKQQRAAVVFEELKKLFTNITDISESTVHHLLKENAPLIRDGFLNLDASTSNTNSTFLHTAAWFRQPNIIRWLLEYGADPNVPNLKGNTPVHFACENMDRQNGRESCIAFLEGGGDLTMTNYTENRTPLQKAPSDEARDFLINWKPRPQSQQSTTDEVENMLSAAFKAAESQVKSHSDAKRAQEDAMAAKLAQGSNRAARKHANMVDTAVNHTKQLHSKLASQQEAQEAALQAKIAAGGKRGAQSEAAKKIEALAHDVANQRVAMDRQKADADEELMRKLANRKKGRHASQQEDEEDAAAAELMNELKSNREREQDAHQQQLAAAEDDFQRKLQRRKKQRRKKVGDHLQVNKLFALLDRTGAGSLPAHVLRRFHMQMHECCVERDIVDAVVDSVGAVTPDNLLYAMEMIQQACKRHDTMKWDYRMMDADETGSLAPGVALASEVFWQCNSAPQHPSYREFLSARQDESEVSAHDGITFDEFRSLLLF
jgi:ankyrin repeat protein